ncbi:hypothetical protein V8E36_003172 [Tilletia maclaganii]
MSQAHQHANSLVLSCNSRKSATKTSIFRSLHRQAGSSQRAISAAPSDVDCQHQQYWAKRSATPTLACDSLRRACFASSDVSSHRKLSTKRHCLSVRSRIFLPRSPFRFGSADLFHHPSPLPLADSHQSPSLVPSQPLHFGLSSILHFNSAPVLLLLGPHDVPAAQNIPAVQPRPLNFARGLCGPPNREVEDLCFLEPARHRLVMEPSVCWRWTRPGREVEKGGRGPTVLLKMAMAPGVGLFLHRFFSLNRPRLKLSI